MLTTNRQNQMVPNGNAQTPHELGQLVRRARLAAGLTQQDLADIAGTGRRFVSELEAGKPTTQLGKAMALLGCLGLHLQVVTRHASA